MRSIIDGDAFITIPFFVPEGFSTVGLKRKADTVLPIEFRATARSPFPLWVLDSKGICF